MKIAIASENGMVARHFGHCPDFTIFEINNGKIVHTETIPNPGHKPGFLPVFLRDKGADVIVAGGMGQGAVELFSENNIKVITGAVGDVTDTAYQYLQGNLQSTDSICHDHQYENECGNHH
ncbi:MAG: NifB/NifX family molybdenum-iron cluster-binding protein [Megasphaera sp.]|jgi:predicted Fe-Mo cluster-binding NifX family protein|uniref:NifB/NifX family molybdenum-iron cluster-binding protein n=1 Tax=Megasphaera sueciensis TaxID=349094 RepID=UPI003CFE7CF4|nr:NifB/NifX family molybdenum-iron cluster-binding protein [Megasphaera sp.]